MTTILTREQKVDELLTERLGFESTEIRGRDQLDFMEVGLNTAKDALFKAFDHGFEHGINAGPQTTVLRGVKVTWNKAPQNDDDEEYYLNRPFTMIANATGTRCSLTAVFDTHTECFFTVPEDRVDSFIGIVTYMSGLSAERVQ